MLTMLPAAAGSVPGREFPAQKGRGLEIDGEVPVPVGLRRRGERSFLKDGRAVNQHVDPAELIDGRLHESSRGGDRIGEVGGDSGRPASA